MFRPKGYYSGSIYVGFLPNGKKMIFPTESEYMDYIRSYEEEIA